MKLYYYDHCPFCVRVRLAAGLLGQPLEEIPLANDDEDTPIKLVGKKVLPILIREDGSPLAESLDIVAYLDRDGHFGGAVRPELAEWLQAVNGLVHKLAMPRNIMVPLPEFASDSAKNYYREKKEAFLGERFSDLLAQTPKFLAELDSPLRTLTELLGEPYAAGAVPGIEDIYLFPVLRNLTIVKGLPWPEPLRQYLENLTAKSGVATYFGRSV